MSFYGQMRWTESTLGNWFYGIKLTGDYFKTDNLFNDAPDTGEGTITAGDEKYLYPHEDLAKLTINSGNHWLGIAPIDCTGDNHVSCSGFSLFHNKPQVDNLNASSCQSVILPVNAPSDNDFTTLKSGGYIKVSSPKFDKAGHWAGKDYVEEIIYQLPNQGIQIIHTDDTVEELKTNGYDKFEFKHDEWIKMELLNNKTQLSFSHTQFLTVPSQEEPYLVQSGMIKYTPPEGETPIVTETIVQGDYFKVFEARVDAAGHVIKLDQYLYRFAPSEQEERVADLLDWWDEFIADADEAGPKTLAALQEAISDINDEYTKSVQDVNNLLTVLGVEHTTEAGEQAFTTAAAEFLALREELKRISGNSSFDNYSLLKLLNEFFQWLDEQSLRSLQARLIIIENQLGIYNG